MSEPRPPLSAWRRLALVVRAVIVGVLVAMPAANVWLLLLTRLRMPAAAITEVVFLGLYLVWVSGVGPPRSWRAARRDGFRRSTLSAAQWAWGLLAALSLAATVHASMVVLFRFIPFPAAAFHAGYDLSFLPNRQERWLAVVVSAAAAGICEETGLRGYLQRPLERGLGARTAILVSSACFTLLHLGKGWAIVGMVPIVFGAGLLLGTLAWASGSLTPGIVGHTLMDIGLFGYWWTQLSGTFSQRPVAETGLDPMFWTAVAALALAVSVALAALGRLRRLRLPPVQADPEDPSRWSTARSPGSR